MATPSAPQNLTVSVTGNEVEVSWAAPESDGGSPVTLYVVYVAPSADGPWLEMAANTPEVLNAGFLLVAGSDYYLVEAWNTEGTGDAAVLYAPSTPAPPEVAPEVEAFRALYPLALDLDATIEALYPHAVDLVTSRVLVKFDPADEAVTAVLATAACHQVAAWLETGDLVDLAGYASDVSVKLVGFEVSGQAAAVSPRAVRALRAAGLLNLPGA